MLTIKNLAALEAQFDRIFKNEVERARQTYRGLNAELVNRLIGNSPQYSGDFASNWNLAIGSPNLSFSTGNITREPPEGRPWQLGDSPAIAAGLARVRGSDEAVTLYSAVYISNASAHDSAYAVSIYDLRVPLRDVNLRVTLKDVVHSFRQEFAGDLTPAQVTYLRRRRAGNV